MQMRSCVFLNDETRAFRGLHALHAAGLTGFFEVAFGAVAGQQFLDHGVLSYGSLERKADRHVKVPASGEFKRRGPYVLAMEARSVDSLPRGIEWHYEPKWDGFRCLLIRTGDSLRM